MTEPKVSVREMYERAHAPEPVAPSFEERLLILLDHLMNVHGLSEVADIEWLLQASRRLHRWCHEVETAAESIRVEMEKREVTP